VDGAAGIDGVAAAVALAFGVEGGVDELPHAAATTAIGMAAAAVQAKRILLSTGGTPLLGARLRV
jgi:hypothetical protein